MHEAACQANFVGSRLLFFVARLYPKYFCRRCSHAAITTAISPPHWRVEQLESSLWHRNRLGILRPQARQTHQKGKIFKMELSKPLDALASSYRNYSGAPECVLAYQT